ncbi:hypothetical protein JCM3770_005465 [Rhodotorula araucariae]
MLDLLDWDDAPASAVVQGGGERRSSSPATGPPRGFGRPRTASLASTAFSMLTEDDQCGDADLGDCAGGESEGDEGSEAGTGDGGDCGSISGTTGSDDAPPGLSYTSASERGSPSPSPPTPDPLDFDSLDEPLFAFPRSPTPVRKDPQSQALPSEPASARHADRAATSSPSCPFHTLSPCPPTPPRLPRPEGARALATSPWTGTRPASPRTHASAAAGGPPPREASPTQAQMDAFFGFVDRDADMRAVDEERARAKEAAHANAGDESASVCGDPASFREGAGDPDGVRTRAEADYTQGGHAEQAEDVPPAAKEAKRYFQLSPLPKDSLKTGMPHSAEERRLAIIDSLERLVFSVFQQLVDSVAPEPSDTPFSQPSAMWRKVTVVLAKRNGNCGADGPGDAPITRTQAIKFPRRYGHGGNLRLGGRELACLLKVIELILEGLKSGVVCTKRDLYYRDVGLFVKQYIVDSLIDDIAATLNVRRSELNVVATAKGLFAGGLSLVLYDGSELVGGERGALIPAGRSVGRLQTDNPKWILVIEKDATFHSLASSSLLDDAELGNGILLTGKGYPDLATRELLKRLSDELASTPIFALVDSDPHGLSILSVYKHGSSSQAHDSANLVVPRVQWLGVKGSEWDALGVGRDELLPLTKADRGKALAMLKKEGLPNEWRRELEYMLHLNRKAEIQVLCSSSPSSSSTAIQSSATQASPRGKPGQQLSRLVEYVKKALWLALDDVEDDVGTDGDGDA